MKMDCGERRQRDLHRGLRPAQHVVLNIETNTIVPAGLTYPGHPSDGFAFVAGADGDHRC